MILIQTIIDIFFSVLFIVNFDFLPEQYVQKAEHQSLTTMIFFGSEEILLKIEIYYKVVSCKLKPY